MAGSVHHLTWTLLISSAVSVVMADYPCLCSYAVDFPLYSRPDVNSAIIDHLYEFDCKPQYQGITGLSTTWRTVMTNHQIGYIQNSNSVSKEVCPGNIPTDDKVTTGQPTKPSTPSSTTAVTPTTIQQQGNSTASKILSSAMRNTSGIPLSVKTSPIMPAGTAVISKKPSSYTTDSAFTASTFSGPNSPSRISVQQGTGSGKTMTGKPNQSTAVLLTTTKLAPPPSSVTPNLMSTKPTSVQQTTTVSSKSSVPAKQQTTTVHKSQSTTASKSVKSTTATKSTPIKTAKPSTGRHVTATMPTTTTPSKPSTRRTTQHYIPHITQPVYHTTYQCPNNVISAARYNHGTTGVYGSTCYELVPVGYTWKSAENNCKNKGGHLVHIRNPTEETNVMRFLHDSRYTNHAVWLGLTDLYHENTFYWSSGDPVTYTKWLPGHTNNFLNHHYEDCVVLVPYKKGNFLGTYGIWDDIDCLQLHPWICQYNAISSQHWINSIFGHGNYHATNNNHIVFTTNKPVAGALGNVLDLIGRK